MASYSVVDAKNELSKLIDRAIEGEEVTITRHGKPVVILRAVASALTSPPKGDRLAMLEWLRARREALAPSAVASADLIRQMRDEGL